MNEQDETGDLIRRSKPDTTLQEASIDIDTIVQDGYRSRRRGFAVVGAAATTGVAAVAAVLAFSAGLLAPVDGPEGAQEFPAGEPFGFDPAQAGYPGPAPDAWDDHRRERDAAFASAFGDLAVGAGFLDAGALDHEQPSDEEIAAVMEEHGAGYYEALSELGYNDLPLQPVPWSSPGNGGQVHLRGFTARDGDEEAERSSFTITAVQPGGWTAEPGPTGGVAFPQHLISDEASWSDEAPVFETERLEDGRTLMTADHGCALEAAVVYPNGSGLRSSWDLDCEGQGREMSMEELTAAMLAMPQLEYDTSELASIGELLDVPPGWAWDEEWEDAAAADSASTFDAAADALNAAHPGVELRTSRPSQFQPGADVVQRTYAADYSMPFEDAAGYPVHFSVRYHLPGGWLPGLPPEGTSGPYLLDCQGDKDDVCEESEVGGRTVATRTFDIGESRSYWVVVYDPAGWAVAFDTTYEGPVDGYGLEDVVALAAALPAPVYDPAEYERD
ncbi:hypothetical protein LO763_28155 [Glycomyces sp. A-F 0318]|uniref:hypothetical protein n=1 Tax=Glycomyces amatae TaxID=2881355 RepID=UPI001E288F6B|nr:hypothetical protein [Glycomyces amatae]MCD0447495.1 hypothetical protein [Glycomyces amatae]